MSLVRNAPGIAPDWRARALATRGFMPADEGDALYDAAIAAVHAVGDRPIIEIGSYCGRSTVWLGAAAAEAATVVFAVDHHHGSEENQLGWEHHDPELVDPATGQLDTLGHFRATIAAAGLDDVVIAVVGESVAASTAWHDESAAMVFIDGGHGVQPAADDYRHWAPKVAVGGTLAIHDVFADPADGGRPPYEQIYLPALESGRFSERRAVGSLRLLERV